MCGNVLCIAAVVLGIEAGWQPLPEGGVRYLIQIEPGVIETLRSGEPIESDIPPQVKDVRGYRISVGTEQLPRELPPAAEPQFSSPSEPNTLPPDPISKPLVEPATLLAPAEAAEQSEASAQPAWQPNSAALQQQEPPKPWLPLTLALLMLFASLGGNAYLLWIASDFRRRYRTLLHGADATG